MGNKYKIFFKTKALKDLRVIPKSDNKRVLEGLKKLEKNFSGNVKKLTNITPEYRLRVGKFRVLFELSGNKIIVYRILHRKDAYKK